MKSNHLSQKKPLNRRLFLVRLMIYLVGMVILALGILFNTHAGLGSSAIISIPYTISRGTGWSLANLTMAEYFLLVILQFLVKGKNRTWIDLFQLLVSVIFTRFMALFERFFHYESGHLPMDLAVLVLGIVLTGIGAAVTVDMDLIPNPGDGIVYSIAQRSGKEIGFTKNCVDVCCVLISFIIGSFYGSLFLGVGLGTICSMIGVGRVISVFNHFCRKPLRDMAGIDEDDPQRDSD